ncbi:MAG: HAD family phosphatase [Candidatus Kapaibacterium sp.]
MGTITTIFSDVGGVILTNGWDRNARRVGAEKFGLDWEEFQDRHDLAGQEFEIGRISLDQYLARTIFYRHRDFTPDQFKEFMFAQSQPFPETLAIMDRLARSGRYLMSTLNNEELELNNYRIEHFELRKYFTLFLSSCFLHMRKPDEVIYRTALAIVQRRPEECLFIDDRRLNVEAASALGIRTILHENPEQLLNDLVAQGIELAA